ncbi:MAG: flagellar biosynthetic protein FliR [Armatimonadetes bacterium]|nr:flagellar biosynthetic protein FliR [Armatimonadota bacterium]
MSLDSGLIVTFLSAFARCTAMLLSSPLFGTNVPVKVRVQFSLVISMALVPVLREHVGAVPQDLIGLVLMVGRDVVIGLIIGGMIQLLMAGIQMAGAFLDIQIGIGMAQIFSPLLGITSSPISQFKFLLGLVILLLINGHHFMFQAFVHSYEMAGPSLMRLGEMQTTLISFMGQVMLMAMQIAAPVAAVSVIIDVAAGLINKGVPQTQPFLLALPVKLMVGLLALSVGLPALVVATEAGLGFTISHMSKMLGGP